MRMRNVHGLSRWALAVLLLAGCATPPPAPTATAGAVLVPTATVVDTATKTAIPATPTEIATATPSAVPTSTPLPLPTIPISPDNASQLTRYARWGTGRPVVGVWQPDSKAFALATTVGVQVRATDTQELIATWEGDYTAVAFSDDSRLLAKAESGGRIEVIDQISGESMRTLQGVEDVPAALAFSHGGVILAVAYRNSTTVLWDLNTGEQVATLTQSMVGGASWARLHFSADDSTISLTENSYREPTGVPPYQRIWDIARPSVVASSSNLKADASFATADSGRLHLQQISGRTAYIFDPLTGETISQVELADSNVYPLVLSSDGQLLAQSKRDELRWKSNITVTMTDTGDRVALFVVDGFADQIAFSPNGESLLVLSGSAVTLGDVTTGETLWTAPFVWLTGGVAISADFTRIAFISGRDTFRELTFPGLEVRREFRLPGGKLNPAGGISYSPDGRFFLHPSEEDSSLIAVEDMETGNILNNIEVKGGPYVRFTPDGQQIILAYTHVTSLGTNVVYHDVLGDNSRGFTTPSFGSRNAWAQSVVPSPAGGQLAFIVRRILDGSDSIPGDAVVWDTTRDRLLTRIPLGDRCCSGLAYSQDGKWLAIFDQRDVKIVSGISLQVVRVIRSTSNITGIAGFSPDGQLLATADAMGEVIWSVDTGQPVARLATGEQSDGLFSRDGLWFVSYGWPGAVTLWSINP